MGEITLNGSGWGTALSKFMNADNIEPGSEPDYQLCKIIYEYHPVGAKLVEAPITLAMSQRREISVKSDLKEQCVERFNQTWDKLGSDETIFNLKRTSRIYGISSVGLMIDGDTDPSKPVDWATLYKKDISFNLWDPLNTSGSLVINQDPNSIDFLKSKGNVVVAGTAYNRSRTAVMFNEKPLYLAWTTSAYGYVGRSVYQRALFPLKSFLETMRTDDLVARKAGMIIAMVKQASSIANGIANAMTAFKRNIIKEATSDNVISIGPDEKIESINLEGVNAAMEMSRKNILNNIAMAAGDPAILINEETFAEGFGEGTEDAKHVAFYIEQFRKEMEMAYAWMDQIVQYRAWNPEFHASLREEFPGLVKPKYEDFFYELTNSFSASWPSILVEPESELAKSDKVLVDAMQGIATMLAPMLDPDNKVAVIQWIEDTVAALPRLFPAKLNLDPETLKGFLEEQKTQQDDAAKAALENPMGAGAGENDSKPGVQARKPAAKKPGA